MSAKLVSFSEAARILGVSTHTIRRFVSRGDVMAVNVGARRLVLASEIDRITQHGVGIARPTKTTQKAR